MSNKISTNNHRSKLLKDLSLFFERFAQLISAEVPLLRALEIASITIKNPNFQSNIMEMRNKMDGGQSITDTFREYPDYFSEFYLAMIEAGERDGHLEDSFMKVAESFKFDAETLELEELADESSASDESHGHSDPPGKAAHKSDLSIHHLSQVSSHLSEISEHLAIVSRELSKLTKSSSSSKSKSNRRKKQSR